MLGEYPPLRLEDLRRCAHPELCQHDGPVSADELAAALTNEQLEGEARRRGIWPITPWDHADPATVHPNDRNMRGPRSR